MAPLHRSTPGGAAPAALPSLLLGAWLCAAVSVAGCRLERQAEGTPTTGGQDRGEVTTLAAESDVEIRALLSNPRKERRLSAEYVELRNDGATDVDLGGWRLDSRGDSGYVFPAGTSIQSGGRLDLGRSADPYRTGGVRVRVVYSGIALDTLDDWLVLRDQHGHLADSVSWHHLFADQPLTHRPPQRSSVPASQAPGSGRPPAMRPAPHDTGGPTHR